MDREEEVSFCCSIYRGAACKRYLEGRHCRDYRTDVNVLSPDGTGF